MLDKVYISHLTDRQAFCKILEQYPVGIETIEFSISYNLDLGQGGISAYVESLSPYIENRPLSLHGPFFDLAPASFDSKIRAVTMERFETVYQIAKQLGARRIIFHSGFIPITYYIEGWLGNSIGFWKEFMANKDDQIEIHLENVYEKEFWPLIEVIDAVAHPQFSACLDVGHVHAYSDKSLKDWIEALAHRIGHVHLHNNSGDKDEHLGLTNGTIDMPQTLEHIQRVSPEATYTLEVSDPKALKDSLEWLGHLVKQ